MSIQARDANQPAKSHAVEKAQPKKQDIFDHYLTEDDEDRKSLRVSLVAAAAAHLVLLAVTLPAMSGPVIPEPEEQQVYVLQQPRYEKPPPPPEQPPKQEVVEIPMPDDTPDEEEPLVLDEPVPVEDHLKVDDLGDLAFPEAPPAVEPEGPIRVGGEIERPERVHSVDPAYTEPARRARIEGPVILEAIIDKSGNVRDVKILRGQPLGLSESAVEAVRQWRYTPSVLNGKPVEVKMTVTVVFNLN